MYLIVRGSTPTKLLQAEKILKERLQDPDYDVWAEFDTAIRGAKREVKDALLKQQRAVCCYCTRRITYHDMKVEHWSSQADFPEKRLDWKNLFAACDGGERAGQELCCDSSKDDNPITLDPTSKAHIEKIDYAPTGSMTSKDSKLNFDIDKTLNLNTARLRNARRAAWDGFRKANDLKREKLGDRPYTQKLLDKALDLIHKEQATPYLDIVLYFLGRKVKEG